MFFGMNLVDFMLFIIIVSFAEALYAPMINVFTFDFTKPGREGTFLTLTAAPVYFTMALTGIMGGYLLENYYPAVEDETHKRQPQYIWLTIIVCSGVSCLLLYLGRSYFNCKEENEVQQISSTDDNSPINGKAIDNGKLNNFDKSIGSIRSAPDSAEEIEGLRKGRPLRFLNGSHRSLEVRESPLLSGAAKSDDKEAKLN